MKVVRKEVGLYHTLYFINNPYIMYITALLVCITCSICFPATFADVCSHLHVHVINRASGSINR